jgi:alanyl-tRNA synthetase
MRHAHLLGAADPLLHRLVPALIQQMGAAYPELVQTQSIIEETLLQEETRFRTTLDRGLKLLEDEVGSLGRGASLAGATAFKLYDTFGFPLDLTQDALREIGMSVDTDGFDKAMAKQKAKARAAWTGSGEVTDESIWFEVVDTHGVTDFLGYDTESVEGQIVAVVQDKSLVNEAKTGASVQIVLNQTPFYAESGGQVGDKGLIKTVSGLVLVTDTRKSTDLVIHFGNVIEGKVKAGQAAELNVDADRRSDIRANHSATHLLHEALRIELGDHVAQRGSLNAADRLRFDFSHGHALSQEQISKVQTEVNSYIRQNGRVETRIMTPDAARELGAQALFGEKYGEEVRVVSMGLLEGSQKGGPGNTYSLELCGGTHVRYTGDIGSFVIINDSASSSGVRRIEALTGRAAETHIQGQAKTISDTALSLKVQTADIADRTKALLEERKLLQLEVANLRRELALIGGSSDQAVEPILVAGTQFLAQVLTDVSGKDLPALVDAHKVKMGSSGVVLLIADSDGKAAVAAGVSSDLIGSISAVDIVRAAVAELGGQGGGGRADMAQGGAKSSDNADAAIAAVKTLMEG